MLKQLLSVFLESRCPFCDRLIKDDKINRTTPQILCHYCLQKLLSYQLAKSDRLSSAHDLPIFAWGKYDGQLKRAIALMKYNNQPEIGRLLGLLLGQIWLDSGLIKPQQQVSVIPIPLHSQKLKARGFNQAKIIAQGFCHGTGYCLNSQVLIRNRETQAMFNLNSQQRSKNLQGAFKLSKKLPRYPVLILDDIYTTGTTINESVRVLNQHQIKVIGAVVTAKTLIDG